MDLHSWKMLIHSISLWFILLIQLNLIHGATICFPTATPYIFGSPNGDTKINSFAFSNGDFIVGGSVTDVSIIGAGSPSPSPFVSYILSGGSTIKWSNTYIVTSTPGAVASLKLTNGAIVIGLDTSPLIIIVLSSTDGSVIGKFKDTSSYSGTNVNHIVNDGITMTYSSSSSYYIFISMTTKDNRW
jgi:hypothetical protein